MIVNPASIDAYIAKKGLVPRISDTQWEEILRRIAELYGHELWHRCRLIHQVDNTFDRYSTVFPDAVPKPYRHIRHLEILVCDSLRFQELKDWLTSRDVPSRECRQRDSETEQEEVFHLQIFGYDTDATSASPSAPCSSPRR